MNRLLTIVGVLVESRLGGEEQGGREGAGGGGEGSEKKERVIVDQ